MSILYPVLSEWWLEIYQYWLPILNQSVLNRFLNTIRSSTIHPMISEMLGQDTHNPIKQLLPTIRNQESMMVSISVQRLQPSRSAKRIYRHRCNAVLSLQDRCYLPSNAERLHSQKQSDFTKPDIIFEFVFFPFISLALSLPSSLFNDLDSFRNGLFPIPYFLSKIGVTQQRMMLCQNKLPFRYHHPFLE